MRIITDENMPFVEELFSPYGEVQRLSGRHMSPAVIAGADVLLVRSVTRVDAALLQGSNVKFVGSATIGTDHIDQAFLHQQGIAFAGAPGCNAVAVMNYVLASLSQVDTNWRTRSVGIIGCGNVGRAVYHALQKLDVACRCYDPFLTDTQQADLCTFEDVLENEILCLHTPLTTDGPYPTYHMFDHEVLASLKSGTLILNAGRGAVVDNRALKGELATGRLSAILDVWEDEPAISRDLLHLVALGTPHIAGYSLEGRLRGTTMVYEAFCRWMGVTPKPLDARELADDCAGKPISPGHQQISAGKSEQLVEQLLAAYNPQTDYQRLLTVSDEEADMGEGFDRLRKNYPLRREFVLTD